MSTLDNKIADFLAQRRIAVAGVSRNKQEAANLIYRKLKGAGYDAFAINPNATTVEGDVCYPDVASIGAGVDAVVAVVPPGESLNLARDCARHGISRFWMHRGIGPGSVSDEAIAFCRSEGISVIAGACPMMYVKPVDTGHKCIWWVSRVLGRIPPAEAPVSQP